MAESKEPIILIEDILLDRSTLARPFGPYMAHEVAQEILDALPQLPHGPPKSEPEPIRTRPAKTAESVATDRLTRAVLMVAALLNHNINVGNSLAAVNARTFHKERIEKLELETLLAKARDDA